MKAQARPEVGVAGCTCDSRGRPWHRYPCALYDDAKVKAWIQTHAAMPGFYLTSANSAFDMQQGIIRKQNVFIQQQHELIKNLKERVRQATARAVAAERRPKGAE